MNKGNLEILKAGRARLEDRSNWTQGKFGDGGEGRCALGTLTEVADGAATREAHRLLIAACTSLPYSIPIGVNDVPPPDEAYPLVLRMYDIAIALAGEREAGGPLTCELVMEKAAA